MIINDINKNIESNKKKIEESSSLIDKYLPQLTIKKKIYDTLEEDILNSNMSAEAKALALFNIKDYYKSLKNKSRIAQIAKDKASDGTDFSSDSGVDESWLRRFLDSAGFISDEVLQQSWGALLAKEFESPNSVPLSLIRIMSELSPRLAHVFDKISRMKCLFVIYDEEANRSVEAFTESIIPYSEFDEKINKIGVTFEDLSELESIGLIKFDFLSEYCKEGTFKDEVIIIIENSVYYADTTDIKQIKIGNVILTQAGKSLRRICSDDIVEGYGETIKEYFNNNGLILKENDKYIIEDAGDRIKVRKKE